MKQSLLKTMMLMLMLMVGMGVWATDVVFNFKTLQTTSGTVDGISWETGKTGSATATACNETNGLVLYGVSGGGGYFNTTSATSGSITKVVLNTTAKKNTPKYTAYASSNGTDWTELESNISAGAKTINVSGSYKYFKIQNTTNATAQLGVSDVTITYTSGGDPTPTKYSVTIANDIANGTVTANPTSAAEGSEVTLTATPGFGCEFDSWNVTNASTSEAITVTNNKFTMPAANVNVSATFNAYSGDITTMSSANEANIKFVTGSSSTTGAVWANSTPLTANNITLSGSVTSGTNYSYYDGSVVRFYTNNNLVITPAAGTTIEKVEIVRQSTASNNGGTINCGELTASNGNTTTNTNVFTGSATSAVTFTASAQARFTAVYVYSVSVPSGPSLSSISVKTNPTKVTYIEGEFFNPGGLVITKTFDNGNTEDVTYDEETRGSFTFTPSLATELSDETSVTINYGGQSTSQSITVNPFVIAAGTYNISLNASLYNVSTGNNGTEQSESKKGVTVVSGCSPSAGSKTYYDAAHIRYYIDSYLKLTAPTGYIITSVVFAEPSSDTKWDATKDSEVEVNVGTYTNKTKSWSGTSAQVDFSFKKQCRIASINVTYAPAPTSTNITISAAGYSTYYNSETAYTMPDGLTGCVVTWNDDANTIDVDEYYASGEAVPAEEPLVLKGNAGTYTLVFTTTGNTSLKSSGENILDGTDVAESVSIGDNELDAEYYFYGLSLNSSSDVNSVGFYWMAADGSPFVNGAHKAYLAIERDKFADASAPVRFVFGDTETAIKSITTLENGAIFNLAGQRVGNDYKGIVIKNGKKVLVK